MFRNKRKRTPYSQRSQQEKDEITAKKTASYQKKHIWQNKLFPVGIEDQISMEENISSSLSFNSLPERIDDEDNMSSEYTNMDTEHKGMFQLLVPCIFVLSLSDKDNRSPLHILQILPPKAQYCYPLSSGSSTLPSTSTQDKPCMNTNQSLFHLNFCFIFFSDTKILTLVN